MHEIFSDTDLLRLLQLQTRRVLANRKGANAKSNTESSQIQNSEINTVVPEKWELLPEGLELHQWQRECLPIWLVNGRGTVKVATGGGKTLFALAVAQQLQNELESDLRLVIVVPTIPLMYQWLDELSAGNLPKSAIGFMGGGQEISPHETLRVLICVLNSARDRLTDYITKAQWAEKMLLVVDECHRSSAEQARRIFDSQPRYTLGLSATPEQEGEVSGFATDRAYNEGVVGRALGPIIYDFTLRESLAAGLLTPFEVWHVGVSLQANECVEYERMSREISELRRELQVRHRRSRSTQGFIAWCQTQASRGGNVPEAERFIGLSNQRKRLLYCAAARCEVALHILSEVAIDVESRAIVFHESIEEIEDLFLKADSLLLPVVLEHSQLPSALRDENIEAFRSGIARIIISAKSLIEGFNVPSADLGLIMASSGSVRQRIQSLGRMLRRKAENRKARILILYVRGTEDEAIYESADWDNVIGAERNRYFVWAPQEGRDQWPEALAETGQPPRSYKPPSWEVDVSNLNYGDAYPGRSDGIDLKVDQANNLRTDDGLSVPAAFEIIQAIVERNIFRRARLTPAGHLIVRIDAQGSEQQDWCFLGQVDQPREEEKQTVRVRLRIRRTGGRRVIAYDRDRNNQSFALGPDETHRSLGRMMRDRLFDWVDRVAREQACTVTDIYWDQDRSYWLEINNQRILYDGEESAPLEFAI